MTFFIKLENGQPASNPIAEENFRQLFPHTSFPAYFTSDTVEPLGYGIYDFSNQPELQRYQKAVETSPVRNEYGIWRQAWQVVDMSAEEKTQTDANKEAQVRGERNFKLAKSDWSQLPDAPLTDAQKLQWQTYRQALRDVTSQTGFPWDVQWPAQPE